MNWDWRSWFRRAAPKPEPAPLLDIDALDRRIDAAAERGRSFVMRPLETYGSGEALRAAGFPTVSPDQSTQARPIAGVAGTYDHTTTGSNASYLAIVSKAVCECCGAEVVVWRTFADDRVECVACASGRI